VKGCDSEAKRRPPPELIYTPIDKTSVELLRRTKNLRVVQEHLRHEDVQTTTGYTKITQQDVQQALETFDNDGE
jgi:integrase